MANYINSYLAALLNDGQHQILPVSKAHLIELVASDKSKFGNSAQSVQDALSYLAGSFEHANNAAKTAQDNAYAYVGQEINKLDVAKVGSDTDKDHNKFISYIYQEDGKIKAFAQEMNATNVAYSGAGTTVDDELKHINATIANNLTATTLKLVKVNGESEEEAKVVYADGSTYKLKQGSTDVASFNIEKDSFVKNGEVVRGTLSKEGVFTPSDNGEYHIKLEIRTQDDTGTGNVEHTLYIPAESLVDAYTAKNGDNNVIVTVTKEDNTISAVIKAGGVGTTELAADAVTTAKIANDAVETAKIADKNVTKAKLEQSVQTSLDKADSAVQSVTEGSTAGAINVDDTTVKVHGLATVATTGAAADVSVATNDALTALAGVGQAAPVQVQATLELIASKVNAINSKTYVNSVQGKAGTNDGVELTFETTTAQTGDATLQIKHSLGNTALLHYDSKTTNDGISAEFFNAVIGA